MKRSVLLSLLLGLAGCSSLRPVQDHRRYFVLSDSICSESINHTPTRAVGIAKIGLREYLKTKAIAVHQSNSEVGFSDTYYWAEPLDTAIQQTIARDMGLTNVHLNAWSRESVQCEIYTSVEQFDLDETGTGTLQARVRLNFSSAAEVAYSAKFSRTGLPLANNPSEAIRTLSALIGDLSCDIANRCGIQGP